MCDSDDEVRIFCANPQTACGFEHIPWHQNTPALTQPSQTCSQGPEAVKSYSRVGWDLKLHGINAVNNLGKPKFFCL